MLLDGTGKEVDVFGVLRGKVIAGEVKRRGADFDRQQIQRDFALTRQLGADMHVMAWMGSLPEASREIATDLARRNGVELRMLSLDELRN